MKILVTGAAGFLGAETVRLALAGGHDVRAMVRTQSPRDRVPAGAAIVIGEMADPATFPAAVEGIEGIIHCAATTSQGAPDAALSTRVNVEGMARLVDAARAPGVARGVPSSSMASHPATTSVYGLSKRAGDEWLRAAQGPPAWTILRPSLIYGPGERGITAKTVALLQKLPVVPIVGSGRERIRPVYVEDVARAALRAFERPQTAWKTYMIGGADEVTLNDFMAALARGAGLRRPLVHLPLVLASALAKAMGLVLKNPPLTEDNVKGVREAQRVEIDESLRDLDYAPIGLAEGLRRTFTPRPS